MQILGGFFSSCHDGDGERGHYETLDRKHARLESSEDSDDNEVTEAESASNQTVSAWKSAFNVMNYLTGGGFLVIPYAVKLGGITALLSLVLVPCALWYTGKLLIDCLYSADRLHGEKIRVRSTYGDIGEACLPRVGGILVDILVYSDLFIAPVFYFVLCGQLLSFTLPSVPLTQTTWVLVTAAVVLPTIFIEKLGQIAWLSVVGVSAVLGVVVASVIYGAIRISIQAVGPQSSELLLWSTENVALAVGISFFCYESHNMLTDMEEHMVDRQKFRRALFGGYAGVTIVKIIFALVTFWAFGQNTQELILHNLPAGAIRITVTVLFVTSIVFTIALHVHAAMHNFEHTRAAKYLMSILPRLVWFIGTRLIYFILALLIAIPICHFASFSAFYASFLVPLTTMVYPCAFHLRLKYEDLSLYEIIIDVFLVIAGLILWVTLIFFNSKIFFAGH